MDYRKQIAQITETLKEKRYEQKWLAEQSGYCSAHISQVLNGKRKASKRFVRACFGALGINFFEDNVNHDLQKKSA